MTDKLIIPETPAGHLVPERLASMLEPKNPFEPTGKLLDFLTKYWPLADTIANILVGNPYGIIEALDTTVDTLKIQLKEWKEKEPDKELSGILGRVYSVFAGFPKFKDFGSMQPAPALVTSAGAAIKAAQADLGNIEGSITNEAGKSRLADITCMVSVLGEAVSLTSRGMQAVSVDDGTRLMGAAGAAAARIAGERMGKSELPEMKHIGKHLARFAKFLTPLAMCFTSVGAVPLLVTTAVTGIGLILKEIKDIKTEAGNRQIDDISANMIKGVMDSNHEMFPQFTEFINENADVLSKMITEALKEEYKRNKQIYDSVKPFMGNRYTEPPAYVDRRVNDIISDVMFKKYKEIRPQTSESQKEILKLGVTMPEYFKAALLSLNVPDETVIKYGKALIVKEYDEGRLEFNEFADMCKAIEIFQDPRRFRELEMSER